MTTFDEASTFEDYRRLIECGHDVNETDYDGSTPLFNVSSFNMNDYLVQYRKIVNLFLENGADINHQDEHGFTALMKSDSDLFSLSLLEHESCKVEIEGFTGETISSLVDCAIRGQVQSIEYMVKHRGVDINGIINGNSLLKHVLDFVDKYDGPWRSWASLGVKKMIELGADVNYVSSDGFPMIYYARSDYNCMSHLINGGVDVNATFSIGNDNGFTVLHTCFVPGVNYLLLNNGAKIDALTSDGSSPFITVMNNVDIKVEEFVPNFLSKYAKCSIVNKNGISILNCNNKIPKEFIPVIENRIKDENWERRKWLLIHKSRKRKMDDEVIDGLLVSPDDIFRKIVKYV